MNYQIDFSDKAKSDVEYYEKSGNKSLSKKAISLIKELSIHPTTGTGKPEQLKHDLSGLWSRRISREHRLIYEIDEGQKVVNIISLKGHYS